MSPLHRTEEGHLSAESTRRTRSADAVPMLTDDAFDYLRPRQRLHTCVLEDVRVPPTNPKQVVLRLKFCGKGTAYYNALRTWKPLGDEKAQAKRAYTYFAKVGVEGWDNVLDAQGAPIPFSADQCARMFSLLVDADREDKVTWVVASAMNPDNFTEPVLDGGDLGKG